jgi:LysR family transcriptional activator of nhaA
VINYRHLYYFWIAAREGGLARAAHRLGMAVQTVSVQVRSLEHALGHALFKPHGRGLALTPAGEAALHYADTIFQLGEELPAAVRRAAEAVSSRFAMGLADAVPKAVARYLMEPVMAERPSHVAFHEGELDQLLAELALHRLDIVFADRPAPAQRNLLLYSHPLGASPIVWYGTQELAAKARRGFPASLESVPVLLPTSHAGVRETLDVWFTRRGVRPHVVAEFEDSALMEAYGATGLGVFAVPEWGAAALTRQHKLRRIGACDGVESRYFAIGTERKVLHPLVRRLLASR